MAGSPMGEMMQSMDMSAGLEDLMANMDIMGSEMMSQLGNMEMNMKCACTPLA